MIRLCPCVAALLSATLLAQSAGTELTFDVVAIRRSTELSTGGGGGPRPGGRYRLTNLPARSLVAVAHGLPSNRVLEGPAGSTRIGTTSKRSGKTIRRTRKPRRCCAPCCATASSWPSAANGGICPSTSWFAIDATANSVQHSARLDSTARTRRAGRKPRRRHRRVPPAAESRSAPDRHRGIAQLRTLEPALTGAAGRPVLD